MASYSLIIKPSVEKDFLSLPKATARQVRVWFDSLRDNPIPVNSRKLVGTNNRYRVRVGDYRIVYEIDKNLKQVTILRVRHRRDVYR